MREAILLKILRCLTRIPFQVYMQDVAGHPVWEYEVVPLILTAVVESFSSAFLAIQESAHTLELGVE